VCTVPVGVDVPILTQHVFAQAPDFFHGAFTAEGELCGFVCGTLTTSATLTDESMSCHEPLGKTLCIHSVVVEESYRRRGIALWMLRSYLQAVAELPVTRVLLICKEALVRAAHAAPKGRDRFFDAGFDSRACARNRCTPAQALSTAVCQMWSTARTNGT
jgi:GNAT superfamily N-acetyltransferase